MADTKDNAAQQRYEIWEDGQLAGRLHYEPRRDLRELTHTEVDPAFGGRGFASQLVRAALDDARASGRQVVPTCSVVERFITKNDSYLDVVEPQARERLTGARDA